jgi:type 2 lantibiotic biosynthesis protein LanM
MRCEPPGWHLAEPLIERIAALRSRYRDSTPTTLQITQRARPESARAIRWREQFPFEDGPLFAQRLAASNIADDEFLCVTADEMPLPWASNAPAWSRTVVDCYLRPLSPGSYAQGELGNWNDDLAPFLPLVAPLVDHFVGEMRRRATDVAREYASGLFSPQEVHELFLDELLNAYKRMIAPAMVLELNLAGLAGQLPGASPVDRFHSFVTGLGDPAAALRMLARYPVLARQLVVRGENWLDSKLTFLGDLSRDWPAIRGWLNADRHTDRLMRIQAQLGDSHCGGRSVLIATLESGLRLVYKPRSLSVDVHFQDLLKWISDHAPDLVFKTLKVLDRGTHGWVEFIDPATCESTEGVRRFYERQGGYLALLYVLYGSDFHCENVIADGEHPVLVDLEGLFHPPVPSMCGSEWDVAAQAWKMSVLRTGLLPIPMRLSVDARSLDRSGLAAANDQMSPLGVLRTTDAGTDKMHLVRQHLPLPATSHWPSEAGRPVEQIDGEAIVRGFRKVYRLIAAHTHTAHGDDGPLDRFRGDEVRVVLRHTRTYAGLLAESFHPDVLRNALDRDQVLDLLWADVPDSPHLASVVPAECHDLWNGDIPLFRSYVGSRDVHCTTGHRIADFLPEPTDVAVRRRTLAMNEADLERQIWLIRASLATLDPKRVRLTKGTWGRIDPAPGRDVRARLLAQARRIGDRLDTLAWRDDTHAGWMGLRHDGRDEWSVRPLGPELYDGTAGVVLFLAQLGNVTGIERYRELARLGANTLRQQMAAARPAELGIGAFTGWAGVVYVYSHLAVLWEDAEWLTDARRAADFLVPLIETDVLHDVVGGATGCIAGLLALHAVAPSDELLAAAVRCGDHLLRSARDTAVGIGWPSARYKVSLAGFSHGASGIAMFLLRLAQLSGEPRFNDAATAALTYERSLFDSHHGNWADLRPEDAVRRASAPMAAWCHGAAGIGLSRLCRLSEPDAETSQHEIAIAVEATLSSGFGDNHCLCHGDLGNLDFLLQAAEALTHEAWKADVQRLTLRTLDSVDRNGWRCGINKPMDTPGLMTGLAGIGYGMLRLAAPEIVPPITTLCPPQVTKQSASGAHRSLLHRAMSG